MSASCLAAACDAKSWIGHGNNSALPLSLAQGDFHHRHGHGTMTPVHAHDTADDPFRPIFVVGYSRSGTTLLSVMLDRNSQLAMMPETHFAIITAPRFAQMWLELRRGTEPTREQFIRHLLGCRRMVDLRLDPAAVAARLGDQEMTPRTVLKCLMQEYAAVHDKKWAAEKTPAHLLCMEELLAWFPNAKFVWVIRDGRDVVLSMRRAPWASDRLWQNCLIWRRGMAEALRFEKNNPGVVYRVRYEALLRDPEPELMRVHEFLGIPFERQQLSSGAETNVVPDWEREWKAKANEPIDANRAEAWRREASDKEVFFLNSLMGRYLNKLGYSDTNVKRFGILATFFYIISDFVLELILSRRMYAFSRGAYYLIFHGRVRESTR